MHHLPRIFSRSKQKTGSMDPKPRRRAKLERRNAAKDIDYEPTSSSSGSSIIEDALSSSSLMTRSLELSDRTSFRIEGTDGEFDLICRRLGLSGPEDFSIPAAAWEAMKVRSASDILPRMHGLESPSEPVKDDNIKQLDIIQPLAAELIVAVDRKEESEELCARVLGTVRIGDDSKLTRNESAQLSPCCGTACSAVTALGGGGGGGGGIKGARPPLLKPPPSMTLPAIDNTCSTWDLFRDFGPENNRALPLVTENFSSDEEGDERVVMVQAGVGKREEDDNLMRIAEASLLSESYSFTTSNDDDSSSTTTEPMSNISPNGRFRRVITYWERGELLGRGSFGSVYEGISDDGFFFAVKEVSLLDQGSQGRQSIVQLEQEIALLSQFEHDNIVQYYGTEKDESKLYIFLELVTKGSLLKLYQSYHLRDSQVSAYTRQILQGLKYLHDRNVVHRDIKCANILVDASGSVKLADFGLAKATKLNDVKSCKGTAFWMAPEVVNRKNQGYGLPADIWSLGCTVLEMLTRQIPYSHLECMQALFRIGRGEPPPVSDSLSNDASDFILQCLKVNPDDRPTAAQLLDHPFVKRPLPTSSGSASPYIFRRP